MSRVFAYCRVSTTDQSTSNQLLEIQAAGFSIEPQRAITETVSGSIAAMERKGFTKLMDKLEQGDVLVVSRLDRLGRSAMDVRATVEKLEQMGVRVHCLALGGVDLTSAAEKMTMQVLNAVAEFERDLLIERTQAGLKRAKEDGKQFGRPPALSKDQQEQALQWLKDTMPVAQIARQLGTTRQTIMRLRSRTAT